MVELYFFFELGGELGLEGGEAFVEVEVVLVVGKAHVATGGKDVVEIPDALDTRGIAKALDVLVRAAYLAPLVVGAGDLLDILLPELLRAAIDERALIPGVDEKDLVDPITVAAVRLVPREEPERGRDLRVEEKLRGKVHDAVDEPRLDEGLADVDLARTLRGERALGKDEARAPRWTQVIEEVLDPRVVRVARRGHAELPAAVRAQELA